ncbi:uncharacterized protein BP5553_05550 [Venustampulla echinocandica]|uniref:Uncharacterized protein n=1 Tax=Venustampulla echinocandica TaxID=2656787 RepID=A0A370TRF6_9HELO|nr:uncharacterized protein BP5553_05550 [Venustampulla echinocandica]RDL38117.1 hypothetical protein BP5553_05550 [Venustampulla echinocandica]
MCTISPGPGECFTMSGITIYRAQENLLALLLRRVQRLRRECRIALGLDPDATDDTSIILSGKAAEQSAEIDAYYLAVIDKTLDNYRDSSRKRVRKVPSILLLADEVICGLEHNLATVHGALAEHITDIPHTGETGSGDTSSKTWDPAKRKAEDKQIEEARTMVDCLLEEHTDVSRATYCLEQIQSSRKRIISLRYDQVSKLFGVRLEWIIQLLRTDETILPHIFPALDKMNPKNIERDSKIFKKMRGNVEKILGKDIPEEVFKGADQELIDLTNRLKKEFDAIVGGFKKYQAAPGIIAKDGIPAWKAGLPDFMFTYFKDMVGRAMCAHDQRLRMDDVLIKREGERLLRYEGELNLIEKLREAVMVSEVELEWLSRLQGDGFVEMGLCERTRSNEMRSYLKNMGLDKLKLSSHVIPDKNDNKASMKGGDRAKDEGPSATKIQEQVGTSNEVSHAASVREQPKTLDERPLPIIHDEQSQPIDEGFLSKDEAVVGAHRGGSSAKDKEPYVAEGEDRANADHGSASIVKNQDPGEAEVSSATLSQEELCMEIDQRVKQVLRGFAPWEEDKNTIRALWRTRTNDNTFTADFGVRSRIIENLCRLDNERARAAADDALQQLRYEEFEVKRFLDQEEVLKRQEEKKLKGGKDKKEELLNSLEKATSELALSRSTPLW